MMKQFLIVLLLLLPACKDSETTTCHDAHGSPANNCGPSAVYAALTWQRLTGDAVEIVVGPSKGDQLHAQARANVGGEWEWIQTAYGAVWMGEEDRVFEDYFEPVERSRYGVIQFEQTFMGQ